MSLNAPSILIVDDEELSRTLLYRRLENEGYIIRACETGSKALELAAKEKFNLILLDIMLPDISGVQVLEEIKKDPELAETRIIMITATDDRETVLQCIESGATDYLIKPFAMHIVNSRIKRCLSVNYKEISNQDHSNKNILLVDDQELNRDVLAHRLGKSGFEITCAADGHSALHEIESKQFDLIMLDIMMPDMSGVEVLKKIRQSAIHKSTPVIMVTALDDIDTLNECIHEGADDYIIKPLNTELLKIRIYSCLQPLD